MIRLIRSIRVSVILCFMSGVIAYAQNLPRHEVISAYIYNFAKNVKWQNEETIKEFNFLIIGQDKKLVDELINLSKTKDLRSKPIRISSSTEFRGNEKVRLIYVTKSAENKLVDIFDKIEGKNILLVSDNYQDKKLIMINFVESDDGTLLFEINKANILNQHLVIMQDMILLGGTEIDVATLYREGQKSLRSLQKHTENLEKNLIQLEKSIAKMSNEIEIQKDSLKRQTQKFKEQQNILDSQDLLLKEREEELENQFLKIQEQQTILDKQQEELKAQKDNLARGKKELEDLNDKISSQAEILEEKGVTIDEQKNILYLLVVITFLVIVLAFSVYRGYKNKQKLSESLEVKVIERTNELRSTNDQLMVELSERKRVEKELKESEFLYRYLFEQNPMPMLVYELGSFNMLAVNDAFVSHYGYSKDEALTLYLTDLFPDPEKRAIKELSEGLHGHAYAGEWHNLKKDGTEITIEARSHGFSFEGRSARIAVISDITERKKVEETIIYERLLLRMIIDNIPDAIYMKDINCKKILANKADLRNMEVNDEAEVIGKDDFAFYSKELAERFYADDQFVIQTDQPVLNKEEFVINNKGIKTWLLTSKLPLRDEKNQLIGLIGIGQNITERKLAEEKLRQSEEQFRLISENVADMIVVLDLEGKRVYNNPSYKPILGEVQSLTGTDSFQDIHPDDRAKMRELFQETIRTGEGHRGEYRIIAIDGSIHFIESQGSVIRNEKGNIVNVVVVSRDVTSRKKIEEELQRHRENLEDMVKERTAELQKSNNELNITQKKVEGINKELLKEIEVRKHAEIALSESEQRLENILNYAPILVYINDLKGRYIFVNKEFEEVMNLSFDQVINKTDFELFPKERAERNLAQNNKVIETRQSHVFENVSEKKDSTHYYVDILFPIYDAGNNISATCGWSVDITDRKKNEQVLLEAKEKAESADRLKSAFLATMSHELRTPLNSIIGFTGILMKGIAGPLNDEQLKQLGMAKGSAKHLLDLINDVLDISKIEAGQLVVSLKEFNFSEMLEKVISIIQPLADKKGLKLTWEISNDVGNIVSDERRVEQIFLNLVNNSIKFTDHGSVKIECQVVDKKILTKVIDTGIGIKEEDMMKLFKPFSQVDTGLTRNKDGTGLGLSISQKLAEKLGGTITVESKVGIGSVFLVTLPL